MNMNSLGAKLVGIGVLVLVGFGLIYNTTYMISAGHTGVVFNKMDGKLPTYSGITNGMFSFK